MSCFGCDTIGDEKANTPHQLMNDSNNVIEIHKSLRQSHFNNSNNEENKGKRSTSTPKRLYDFKDTLMCIFCGGKSCKHENYLKHPNPAIDGLNCDQIDQNIFASQRPSNTLIHQFHLVDQFKEKDIGLIINVQRPGEHPYCGPNGGLDLESGYTYTPSLFISEGINVKLCCWKDMNVPDSLSFMLDIIKEMHYTITKLKKKVLVHCHAGYGRTGIVIVCYKIYSEHLKSQIAIQELRSIRKKCVQNSAQQAYCERFYQCMYIYRLILNIVIQTRREIFKGIKTDAKLFIQYQNDLSIDDIVNPYVPRMITEAFNAIIKLQEINQIPNKTIFKALNGEFPILQYMESCIEVLINSINTGNWECMLRSGDIIIISELLYIWLDESVKQCINPLRIEKIFNDPDIKAHYISMLNDNKQTNIPYGARIAIDKIVQKTLKKYEYHILRYISNLLNGIENNDNDDEHFKLMIEKLIVFLLGYNIKLFYDEKDKSIESYNIIVQKTINLIHYYKKIDFAKDNYSLVKSIKTLPANLRIIEEEDDNKEVKPNLNVLQEGDLFNLYQSLNEYFDPKRNGMINNNKQILENITNQLKASQQSFDSNSINKPKTNSIIIRDYTMKEEKFKASKVTFASCIHDNKHHRNELKDLNQSYRNKIRSTKDINLSSMSKDLIEIPLESKENSHKKLWIKEEDC